MRVSKLVPIAALVAVTLLPVAHAEPKRAPEKGTEVGGGAPGSLEAITNILKGLMGNKTTGPASMSDPTEEFGAWCSRVGVVLSEALKYAQKKTSKSNHVAEAEEILYRALETIKDSLATTSAYEGPLAYALVNRAIEIHDYLNTTLPNDESIAVQTRFRALRAYVQFAKQEIESFDRQFNLAYQFGYLPCQKPGVPYAACPAPVPGTPLFDYKNQFVPAFRGFVIAELQFVLGKNITGTLNEYGIKSVIGVNDERATLRIAEQVARHAAEDLTTGVDKAERAAHDCLARKLSALADNLQGLNVNTGVTYFDDGTSAIRDLADEFNRAKGDLTCGAISAPAAAQQ